MWSEWCGNLSLNTILCHFHSLFYEFYRPLLSLMHVILPYQGIFLKVKSFSDSILFGSCALLMGLLLCKSRD